MNFNNFELYVVDCETTHLDNQLGSPIEISILRLKDNVQRTWFLKALFPETIDPGALKVNGYLLDDIICKTASGKEKFIDANKVIVEIEDFLAEDNNTSDNRIMIGQNVQFDSNYLVSLWKHLKSSDSYPMGRRTIDTMQIEFLNDLICDNLQDSYSLKNILKRYGIKNEKAHAAASDVRATTELFIKQVDKLKKLHNK